MHIAVKLTNNSREKERVTNLLYSCQKIRGSKS